MQSGKLQRLYDALRRAKAELADAKRTNNANQSEFYLPWINSLEKRIAQAEKVDNDDE